MEFSPNTYIVTYQQETVFTPKYQTVKVLVKALNVRDALAKVLDGTNYVEQSKPISIEKIDFAE